MVLMFIVAVVAILAPNTTRPKVLEQFLKLGKGLGFSATSLERVDPKTGKFSTFDKSIEGSIDNRQLRIRTREVSDGESSHWEFYATWRCKNVHKLRMDVYPEGFFSKVRKKFGMQDIEIFNERFDDRFIIQCNHKHFPLQTFSGEFCAKILKQNSSLGNISITKDGVRYTEKICLESDKTNARLTTIIAIMRELAEMVDDWKPMYRISKSA